MKTIKFPTIALAIFAIFTSITTPLYATYPGANGIISYSHTEGPYAYGEGPRVIQSINPDGTGISNISKYIPFQWILGWSPDGRKYLYEKTTTGILGIRHEDGSQDKEIVTSCAGYEGASFSPDGMKIVFDCFNNQTWSDIYIVNIDGSGLHGITNSMGHENKPTWSPDGKHIAYNYGGNIWTINPDGTGAKNLGAGERPDWSPDSKKIAYDNGMMYIMNADGTDKYAIPNSQNANGPAWSPDGTKIAYTSDRGYGGFYLGIYTIDLNGNNKTLLTPGYKNRDDRGVEWQPLPKANRSITLSDAGFVPSITHMHQGWKVRWNFLGESPQAVVDDLAMGMFGSGNEPKGGAYATTFHDAGTYQTYDPTSKRSGSVNVPVKVTPASGPVGTTFTVKWSSRTAPTGKVFDVQEKRPGSTAWLYYLRGVKSKSDTITPTQAGTYS
jgi:TolB protein